MSRERIIAQARDIFGRQGYAETTMRDIAKAVGIQAPSLYAHFSSKQELYEATFQSVSDDHGRFFAELAESIQGLPPNERIDRMLAGVEQFYRDRPQLVDFSLRAAVSERTTSGTPLQRILIDAEDALMAVLRSAYVEAREHLGEEAGADDAEDFVATGMVLMDGLFLQLTHYPPDIYRERANGVRRYLSTVLTTSRGA